MWHTKKDLSSQYDFSCWKLEPFPEAHFEALSLWCHLIKNVIHYALSREDDKTTLVRFFI